MNGLLKFKKIIEYIWAIECLIEELVNKITKKLVIIITYLNKFSYHVDPMVFALLFPLGDLGWSFYNKHPNEKQKCFNEKTKYLNEKNKYPDKNNKWPNEKKKHDNEKTCLTILQYYLYRLSYRPKNFSPILFGGSLTQQYFLHAYIIT